VKERTKMENKEITQIIRDTFAEMKSEDFCGCYDGDINEEYLNGVKKFCKKITKKLEGET
jgi:hypothetical protein